MNDRDKELMENRLEKLESQLERLTHQLKQLGAGFYDSEYQIANIKKKLDAVADLEKIRSIK